MTQQRENQNLPSGYAALIAEASMPSNIAQRGSGRTYRAIEALPDDGIFVVKHPAFVGHVRNILTQQNRSLMALRVICLEDLRAVVGLSRGIPVGVDHDAAEYAGTKDGRWAKPMLDELLIRFDSVAGWPDEVAQ